MRNASISYCGVPMVCRYEYAPAEPRTHDDPGHPEDATIYDCKVGGVDIYEVLTAAQVEDIETLVCEFVNGESEFLAGEYADHKRVDQLAKVRA